MPAHATGAEQLVGPSVAIMQPYFIPYIGYFQLMDQVDRFVVYDNIKFTKKGWIHRNRILVNQADEYISLPLKNDSDFLDIRARFLADSFDEERKKMLRRIEGAYRKAPYFDQVFPFVESILSFNNKNLFDFLVHSLTVIKDYLMINTEMIVSSSIEMDHSLKGAERVMETCKRLGAVSYVNPIGGVDLYDKNVFKNNGIELSFAEVEGVNYPQFGGNFVPHLSIIDVLMFNDKAALALILKKSKRS